MIASLSPITSASLYPNFQLQKRDIVSIIAFLAATFIYVGSHHYKITSAHITNIILWVIAFKVIHWTIEKIREKNLIRNINSANYEKHSSNGNITKALIDKQLDLISQTNLQIDDLKNKVCSFHRNDGKEMTDAEFRNCVLEQIPPNTYEVKITTLPNHLFVTWKKARKIELTKTSNCITAIKQSIMNKKEIFADIIKRGILGILLEDEKAMFKAQIEHAYKIGRHFTIFVPFDHSEDGLLEIKEK